MKEQLARAALHEQLVLLRWQAGNPSLRRIAEKAIVTGPKRKRRIGHETVRQVLLEEPNFDLSWPIVRAVVRSLGGDEKTFEQLWRAARAEVWRPPVLHRCGFPECSVTRGGAQPTGVHGVCQVVDERGPRIVQFYACSPDHVGGAACAAVRG